MKCGTVRQQRVLESEQARGGWSEIPTDLVGISVGRTFAGVNAAGVGESRCKAGVAGTADASTGRVTLDRAPCAETDTRRNDSSVTDAGEALRIASDTLLQNLEALAQLEEQKRSLPPEDPRIVAVASRVEALAKQVLDDTTLQRRLTVERHRSRRAGTEASTTDASIAETPRSMSAILEAWRQAERDLAGTVPGTPDADVAQGLVDRLREEYRRALDLRERRSDGGET